MKAGTRRSLSLFLGLWAALTVIGTLLHAATDGPSSPDVPGLQAFINTLAVLVTPGWAALWRIQHRWPDNMLWGALVANAMGWAVLLAGAWMGLCLLRWLTVSAHLPASTGTADSSRRRFLVQAPAAVIGLGGAGALADGTCIEPWDIRLVRYTIPVRNLPAALHGLRLVQLSDTHLGPRIPASYIRSVIQRAIDLKPDLFALTGDYIHSGPQHIAPAAALFQPLIDAGRPVIGVLGNHDWYSDGPAMSRALADRGVHMIDNRRVWLNESRRIELEMPGGPSLCIAGVGDLLTDWVDIAAALDGVPPETPRLLLSHEPDVAEAVAQRVVFQPFGYMYKGVVMSREPGGARADVMLCGHTHGGQVALPFYGPIWAPSRFGMRYVGGVVTDPGFPVVISRGVGMSIIPVRFGVRPEIVEVTLTTA